MRDDGFQVFTYTRRGAINPDIIRCIRTAIAEFRPDVMHSHLWAMAAYGGLVAAMSRVPHVITMHGDGEQTRYLRRRVALRLAFAGAADVVAVSSDMRSQLARSLGVTTDSMRVVANGSPFAPGNRESTREALGVAREELIFLCVGSQITRKNHVTALTALASIQSRAPWRLVLAGPLGDATELLRREADALAVTDQLINLGPRQDIPDLLAACDIFLMPSLWEGMPVALVEAMGAGKPVIASRVGGISEMITDGAEGILVNDPLSKSEWSQAIQQLVCDQTLRAQIARGAQARAEADYGVERMTDSYLALYNNAEPLHA
jgi:glycosyltransferase involved in cell wall biosynthesis